MKIQKSRKDIEIEIRQLTAKLGKIEALQKALNLNINDREKEKDKLKQVVAGQEQMIRELEQENERARQEIATNHRKIKTAMKEAQHKKDEISKATLQCKTLQAEHDLIIAEQNNTKAVINNLKDQIDEYRGIIDIVDSQIKVLTVKQQEQKKYVEMLANQLSQEKGFIKENQERMLLTRPPCADSLQPDLGVERYYQDLYRSQLYNYNKQNNKLAEYQQILEKYNSMTM